MKILVGIPTYDRRIDIDTAFTLGKTQYELDYMATSGSLLCRSRNSIAREALKYDYLLFLDSDLSIVDKTFLDKMFETMKMFGGIVGGAYRIKDPNQHIYVAWEKVNGELRKYQLKKEPSLCYAVGTGIMLIDTKVLKTLKDPWFTILDEPNGRVKPEDFLFCEKALEAGFSVAIDPRFQTNHYGNVPWVHNPL